MHDDYDNKAIIQYLPLLPQSPFLNNKVPHGALHSVATFIELNLKILSASYRVKKGHSLTMTDPIIAATTNYHIMHLTFNLR